jgi:asparagine synthase (glutamine-hydrolysing)
MSTLVSEPWSSTRSDVGQQDWLVAFDIRGANPGAGLTAPVSIHGGAVAGVDVAEVGSLIVFFAGVLTNERELDPRGTRSHAQTAAALLQAKGADGLTELRGAFAILAWDGASRTLTVVRDHIGLQPLFAARTAARWLFSPSPAALVACPEVSRALDAVAISEWLCGWYPAIEDTAYRDVKRVPPATITTIRARGVEQWRYWDPAPVTEPIPWSREEDLEAFEGLLTRAVTRAMQATSGRCAIFLSGGVDSISVAAAATDVAHAAAEDRPIALSLVFPDAASNEEVIQAAVASRLGLRQHLVPFATAAGPTGLLEAALAMTASWPQPMLNLWAPAYRHLARLAAADGADVILTGRGGDEWLTVTPYVMADYARHGNVPGIWRMLRAWRRAHGGGVRDSWRLFWTTAGRPLASAALQTVVPERWHARRRRTLLSERPAWVAADPAIRAQMDERVDRWMEPARPPHGFYVREMRTALFHPGITHDMEETWEFGRQGRQRVMHPFWDVDLVNALYRVPPDLLMKDGRAKWLLRRRLAARFPGLGLERRVKVSARSVFENLMCQEAPAAWRRLGGVRALAEAGVVSATGVESAYQRLADSRQLGTGRLWALLNYETWARSRAEYGG